MGLRLHKIIFFIVLALAGASPAFACTTALVSAGASKNGRPLIWKQRDTDYEFSVLKHVSDGRYEFTAIFDARDTSLVSAYAGVNEKGLALINNLSYNLAQSEYTVRNGSVMREALACCATVDEFIAFIEELPQPRTVEANFGVADVQGNICYVEVGDVSLTRYDVPENGWLVRTNFSLSGEKESGKGLARYETASYLLSGHKGKITSDFLFDTLARSFYNAELGTDVSRHTKNGIAIDLDFIPRTSSVCDVCIELPSADEPDNSALIWCSTGYPLGSYVVPVWQCAGDKIPSFITSTEEDYRSSASVLSQNIKRRMHPFERDASVIYIDFKIAKPILDIVRRYEREEYESARIIDAELKHKGFDLNLVLKYNFEAEQRFAGFSKLFY